MKYNRIRFCPQLPNRSQLPPQNGGYGRLASERFPEPTGSQVTISSVP